MRRIFFVLATALSLIFLSTFLRPAPVAAGDGIPDNCEYTGAAYEQPNIFPRYEPQNQRLILVDWTTGAEVRTLAENVPDTRILGWSLDCRYLAGAVYNADSIDTVVWDATSGANMGTVPDAHQQAHHLTWGPGNYLIVETRAGAILWNVPAGNRVQLTSTSDGNGRSFKNGVFDWDFANNQLHTWLSIPPYGGAIYDLGTGTLLGISDKFGRAFSTESTSAVLAQAAASDAPWCKSGNVSSSYYSYNNTFWGPGFKPGNIRAIYESYNRQIILMDATSRETLQVVEEGIETSNFSLLGFSPDCHFMGGGLRDARGRYSTVIWDLSVNPVTRVGSFDGAVQRVAYINWSPDSAYAIISGRNAAFLWNLLTGVETRLTPDVDSDCDVSYVGCVGSLFALRGIYWNTPGQVRIGLVTGYQVSVDLASGQVVGYTNRDGQPITAVEAESVQTRLSSPFGCTAKVRYEPYNRRLVLRDWITGELLRVVEDNLELSGYYFEGWSPNCTYLVAAIGPRADSDTLIWNLATNTRVGLFENAIKHPHYFAWSPDSSAVLIQTRNGGYLWNMATNERILLSEAATDDGRNFIKVIWDMPRGQLLAVTVGAPNVITAYDIHSGQVLRTFSNGNSDAQVTFEILKDGYRMTVWNVAEERQAEGFTVWNLTDSSGLNLTTNHRGSPYLKFSDSGRYIAFWNDVFWDTQNLAGGDPHPPTYVRDFGDSRGLTFESDQIVLTYHTSADKYDIARRRYHLTTYRWDLATGVLLSETEETKHFSGYGCCAIPS